MTGDSNVGIEDLGRRLQGGDLQALAELFSRERKRLWRVIQFRLAEPLRARLGPEDVLQEAFLAASQRLGHYATSPASSPFIWLRMIVNQTLVDLHRQHLETQKRAAGCDVALDSPRSRRRPRRPWPFNWSAPSLRRAGRPLAPTYSAWCRPRSSRWTRWTAKCSRCATSRSCPTARSPKR